MYKLRGKEVASAGNKLWVFRTHLSLNNFHVRSNDNIECWKSATKLAAKTESKWISQAESVGMGERDDRIPHSLYRFQKSRWIFRIHISDFLNTSEDLHGTANGAPFGLLWFKAHIRA